MLEVKRLEIGNKQRYILRPSAEPKLLGVEGREEGEGEVRLCSSRYFTLSWAGSELDDRILEAGGARLFTTPDRSLEGGCLLEM